jgi:hypothetical protein
MMVPGGVNQANANQAASNTTTPATKPAITTGDNIG